MPAKLLSDNIPKISYGIREIVEKGRQLEEAGFVVNWENIGDPVNKGLIMPDWIIEIIQKFTNKSESYAYCDSKGFLETRKFLADKTNKLGGTQIHYDDITFFNGLGDAITTIYSLFSSSIHVLQPSPTYPAHSSAERLRTHTEPLTYKCDPHNNWRPDIDDIRQIVSNNKSIRSILIINPDNPTGTVHLREDLIKIVEIAKEYKLLLIVDEIYENIVYTGKMTRIAEVIGSDVSAIAMKGISKEFPWPGSRCGWVEYYNRKTYSDFDLFCARIDQYKMSEVCSTTLPQMVIPEIMSDRRYNKLLKERNEHYRKRMNVLKKYLSDLDYLTVSNGGGGFYAVITINEINDLSFKNIKMSESRMHFFEKWTTSNIDLSLAYFLLAGYGICTVPLNSFGTSLLGFRITLLERSDYKFEEMVINLKNALLLLRETNVLV